VYVLEDDILNVRQDDADTLKKQAQELPLQLRTFVARVFRTVE